MKCPVCLGDTAVIDSRDDPDAVNRRRKCKKCGYKFNTVEIDNDLYKKLLGETKNERNKNNGSNSS